MESISDRTLCFEGNLVYKVWCRRMDTESPIEGHSMYGSSDEDMFEPMEDSTTDLGPFHPIFPSMTTLTEPEGISTLVPTPPQTPDSISRLGSADGVVDQSYGARTDETVLTDVLKTPTVESCQQQGCSRLACSFDNNRLPIPPDMYESYSPVLNNTQNVESFMTEEHVRVLNELEGFDHEFAVGGILSIIRPYLPNHSCLVTEISKTLPTMENASVYVHAQGEEVYMREVLLAYARTYGIRGLLYKLIEVCTKDGCNVTELVFAKLAFLRFK